MSNQSNNNQTVDNSLDTPNNTTQQLPNNESNNSDSSSEGIPIIADGALCKCPKSPGEQVGIIALSQSRVFVNGGSLLAVTTNDKTAASLKFSKCGNKSCSANITWQNAYTDTQILGSLQILTMNSYGVCSQGGKIEFINCGQTEQITAANTKNITGTQTQQLSEENPNISTEEMQSEVSSETEHDPLATTEDLVRDLIDQPVIEILEEGTGKSSIIKSITPVTYPQSKLRGTVKQPRNVLCTFKGAASGTYYWKIRSEDMSVLHEKSGAGQITIRFPKLGRYVIEAYKTTSYVVEGTTIEQIKTSSKKFQNALIVEVVENEITLKAQKTKCSVGNTVDISLEKLFSTLDIDGGQITYQVFSQGIPVADNTQAEITGNSQAATVTFKSAGNYAIHATSSRGIKINPTKVITVEALQVKEVTAKGVKKYKARKGEDLELKAVLNYDTPENQEKVKWEVYYSDTENGSQSKCYPIVNGTIFNNKPPINIFTNIGFYSIYAFINGRSNNVKAVVEICQPKFVSTLWKDANGNNIKEVGKRESVYAHINMEGVSGLSLKFEVYCLQTNKLIEDMSLAQMQSNKAIYKLQLSDNTIKELQEGYKLYIKPSVRNNNGICIINKDKSAQEYPIIYTKKEKITALAFYADKNCKQGIASATYGNIIYARVLTRNLTGKSLLLYMYRNTPGKLWGTNDIELYKSEEVVNDDGYAIFNIKIAKNWKKEDAKDNYFAIVTEEGDNFWKTGEFLTPNSTAKNQFEINRNLQFLRLTDEDSAINADSKTITTVNQVTGSKSAKKGKCPHCEEDITIDQIKQICVDSKGESMIADDRQLQAAVDFFNTHKNFFDLTTCTRKVHFLSQIAEETHFWKLLETSFNYSKSSLISIFSAFRTPEGRRKADLLGRGEGEKSVSKENQIRIANWAYARPGNDRGNKAVSDVDLSDETKDGYRYRGRGYLQITGRGIYKAVSDKYNQWVAIPHKEDKVDWESNWAELENGKEGMAATMTYWKYSNLISRSDMGTSDNAIKVVTQKINGGQTNFDERKRLLQKAIDVLDCKNCVDHVRRNENEGTVVIISGVAKEKQAGFAAYPVSVYRGMTLETYKDLKAKDELPEPDYTTKLSRDTHQFKSKNKKTGKFEYIKHNDKRYGYANECPPGEYYLNNKIEAGGEKLRYEMYLSDSKTGSIINGVDGQRSGIAIHHYTGDYSIGCLTTLEGQSKKLVFELKDAIPDLFIHTQMANFGITIPRRYVRVILEEREVEEEQWENSEYGTTRWRGTITK